MSDKKPFIKVVWEDTADNFSAEKVKRVKSYFQHKYNATSVRIETKSTYHNHKKDLKVINFSDNIFDTEYQKSLMKDYIETNEIKVKWEMIERLDNKVNAEIVKNNENGVKHNRWSIQKIEFSNFFSYGQDNIIDYTTLDGITVVEGNPANFSGKSLITSDLLLFLFFNTTTRTKTNIEIFNKFTNENEVTVRGYLLIDGKNYVIERKLTRKLSKGQDYHVVAKQEFYSVDKDGYIDNLLGEQRRETEKHIQSAIGTEEDFLITVMTTGYNLEELIRTKPTARGTILSKFIGLDILKEKEEIARNMYNDWSKKLISNTNNIKQLEINNGVNEDIIHESEIECEKSKDSLIVNENQLNELEKTRDKYLSLQSNDIDIELIKTNPDVVKSEIQKSLLKQQQTETKINATIVNEPSTYYLESEHEDLKREINKVNLDIKLIENSIKINEKTIKTLEESLSCPTCKREFKGLDNSSEIGILKHENESLNTQKTELNNLYVRLTDEELTLKNTKLEYETYERNKLIKLKLELELEQTINQIENLQLSINRYQDNIKKIEDNKFFQSELIQIKHKINLLKETIQKTRIIIDKYINNIINAKERINNNNDLINKIKVEEELIEVFKTYISIFGKNGFSKTIMKGMVPLINKELFELLYDSCQFSLELDINDKNEIEFNMVDTETRVVKPLISGSGYERTISSLALRSVLSKISPLPKPNIVVMDEVFGMIADENIDMVGEFFKKIKNYFERILIISHNPLIRNWSDNLIMINKPNNISSIEYINIKK